MIIYQGIMTLDYLSATNLLVADMPDIRVLRQQDLGFCFELIVDAITSRHVSKLLLDTSKSVIDLEDYIYKDVITSFLAELNRTGLQRMARISPAGAGENLFEGSGSIEQQQRITFRIFSSHATATDWLLEQKH